MRLKLVMAVSLLGLAASSWADALPTRANGLWELHVKEAGQSPVVVRQCTATSVDAAGVLMVVPSGEVCNRQVKRSKGAWDVQLKCDTHGQKIQTTVSLQGDFKTQYSGRFNSADLKRSGEFSGKWLGVCEAKQKPGDMVLPNGVTINWAKGRAAEHKHDAGHGHKH